MCELVKRASKDLLKHNLVWLVFIHSLALLHSLFLNFLCQCIVEWVHFLKNRVAHTSLLYLKYIT